MINPYYFTDGALQIRYNITLDSHHTNHADSKTLIKPNFPEIGIESRYFNKILKTIASIYARLFNQYNFKYKTIFSRDLINRMKIFKFYLKLNCSLIRILIET